MHEMLSIFSEYPLLQAHFGVFEAEIHNCWQLRLLHPGITFTPLY